MAKKNKDMAELRFKALEDAYSRGPVEVEPPSKRVSDYFGMNVFDFPKMENQVKKKKLF